MSFEQLKNHRNGQLWARLLKEPTSPQSDDFGYYWNDDLMSVPDLPLRRTPIIYHYTTIAGLQGILQSNSLWASAAYCLNDSSEIEYGCKLVLNELTRWQETNRGIESFAIDVLRGLENAFLNPLSRLSRSATIYVACFCEDDNLLSQWRAYGQAGGYSIGFEVDRTWETMAFKSPSTFWDLRLAKVIYNDRIQRAQINSSLRRVFEPLRDNLPGADLAGPERRRLLIEMILFTQELLLDDIVTFKNPAFREESERRLIARPTLIRTTEAEPSQEMVSSFKFRASRGSLIPYLELLPRDMKIPLRSIRYGPSLDGSRVENPLRMLLAASGFTNVQITGSELPVIL